MCDTIFINIYIYLFIYSISIGARGSFNMNLKTYLAFGLSLMSEIIIVICCINPPWSHVSLPQTSKFYGNIFICNFNHSECYINLFICKVFVIELKYRHKDSVKDGEWKVRWVVSWEVNAHTLRLLVWIIWAGDQQEACRKMLGAIVWFNLSCFVLSVLLSNCNCLRLCICDLRLVLCCFVLSLSLPAKLDKQEPVR